MFSSCLINLETLPSHVKVKNLRSDDVFQADFSCLTRSAVSLSNITGNSLMAMAIEVFK